MRSIPRLYPKVHPSTPGSWWKREDGLVVIKCGREHSLSFDVSRVSDAGILLVRCPHRCIRLVEGVKADTLCDFQGEFYLEGWHLPEVKAEASA